MLPARPPARLPLLAVLQDAEGKKREKLERLRYGRFFYRFPHGESGADVYSRMTIFQAGQGGGAVLQGVTLQFTLWCSSARGW